MMTMEDLCNTFSNNQINIECYNLDIDSTNKMNRYYNQIINAAQNDNKENDEDVIDNNDNKTKKSNKIKMINLNDLRQKIENLKTDIMYNMMLDYYEKNKSIVIFVNYISTHNIITERLRKDKMNYGEIIGGQTDEERQLNIDSFQKNQIRVMVSMIQAGGTAISLHDLTGHFPRISIISPSYSRIQLVQTLGRIYRADVRSPCIQKIVYCANTHEENVARILQAKKQTLDKISDDDMNIERNMTINNNKSQDHPIKVNSSSLFTIG
jgi:superfamily II DNA or RNA helicase